MRVDRKKYEYWYFRTPYCTRAFDVIWFAMACNGLNQSRDWALNTIETS